MVENGHGKRLKFVSHHTLWCEESHLWLVTSSNNFKRHDEKIKKNCTWSHKTVKTEQSHL